MPSSIEKNENTGVEHQEWIQGLEDHWVAQEIRQELDDAISADAERVCTLQSAVRQSGVLNW